MQRKKQSRQSRKYKVNQSRKASEFKSQSRRRPNRDLSFFERQPAVLATPVNPANLALQANQATPVPPSSKVRSYMLNHIQRFMGPETTRGYMTGQTFAMLNQNIPSLGRMMFDFLYPGGEPRFKKNFTSHMALSDGRFHPNPVYNNYKNKMFDLFKDYVKKQYIINKLKPVPLTQDEEEIYKDKLDKMIFLFRRGIPDREETLLYLENTTNCARNVCREPRLIVTYRYQHPLFL
jgi:hypothetical protein